MPLELSDVELDEALNRSRPQLTRPSPEVSAALADLQIASEEVSRASGGGKRQWARPVIIGLGSLALVGAAATAAAAAGMWVLPWAENDALASFTFTLPSGIQCEERVGGVSGSNPAEVEAAESYWRRTDFTRLLTPSAIQDVLDYRQEHSEPMTVQDDDSMVPANLGSPDDQYLMAVWDLAVTGMDTQLAQQGFGPSDLSLQAEPQCPGADW